MIELTPKQIDAIHIRFTATCTNVRVQRFGGRFVEVSYFARVRLIETVKISPGGIVTVLS